MKTILTISLVSVLLGVLYVALATQPVMGQLPNVQSILIEHMKIFNPNRGDSQLPPIVIVDRVIPAGQDFVAFNPNHGNTQVITMLSP
jgi:hypothetical protein